MHDLFFTFNVNVNNNNNKQTNKKQVGAYINAIVINVVQVNPFSKKIETVNSKSIETYHRIESITSRVFLLLLRISRILCNKKIIIVNCSSVFI